MHIPEVLTIIFLVVLAWGISTIVLVEWIEQLHDRQNHLASRLRFLEEHAGFRYEEQDGADTWTTDQKGSVTTHQ